MHSMCLTTSTNYTSKQTFHVRKTRGCQCSFRLLMMGGVSPETCWASYKYGIIKFWYIVVFCWIFLYELYCDARIHERQNDHISRLIDMNSYSVLSHKNSQRIFFYFALRFVVNEDLILFQGLYLVKMYQVSLLQINLQATNCVRKWLEKTFAQNFATKFLESSAFWRNTWSISYTGIFHWESVKYQSSQWNSSASTNEGTIPALRIKPCWYNLFTSKSLLWFYPFKTIGQLSTLLSSFGGFTGIILLLNFGGGKWSGNRTARFPIKRARYRNFWLRNRSVSSETSTFLCWNLWVLHFSAN
jgi:hypothetical protein